MGVWPSERAPERFPKPTCEQLALPDAAMPVAQLFPLHCVGTAANAVAVPALPVVLAALFGISAEASKPHAGAALTVPVPVCVRNCFAVVVFPARRAGAGVAFS